MDRAKFQQFICHIMAQLCEMQKMQFEKTYIIVIALPFIKKRDFCRKFFEFFLVHIPSLPFGKMGV